MPTMTVQLSNAGAADRSFVKTISGPHLTRFADAYREIYGGGLTDEEIFDRWVSDFFAETTSRVLRQEKRAAATTAEVAVTPITIG